MSAIAAVNHHTMTGPVLIHASINRLRHPARPGAPPHSRGHAAPISCGGAHGTGEAGQLLPQQAHPRTVPFPGSLPSGSFAPLCAGSGEAGGFTAPQDEPLCSTTMGRGVAGRKPSGPSRPTPPDAKCVDKTLLLKMERAQQQLAGSGALEKLAARAPPPPPWPTAVRFSSRDWCEEDAKQLWNQNYGKFYPRSTPPYYYGLKYLEDDVGFTAETEWYCCLPAEAGAVVPGRPLHLLGRGEAITKRAAERMAAADILRQLASLGLLHVPDSFVRAPPGMSTVPDLMPVWARVLGQTKRVLDKCTLKLWECHPIYTHAGRDGSSAAGAEHQCTVRIMVDTLRPYSAAGSGPSKMHAEASAAASLLCTLSAAFPDAVRPLLPADLLLYAQEHLSCLDLPALRKRELDYSSDSSSNSPLPPRGTSVASSKNSLCHSPVASSLSSDSLGHSTIASARSNDSLCHSAVANSLSNDSLCHSEDHAVPFPRPSPAAQHPPVRYQHYPYSFSGFSLCFGT